jgi:hypothetical protein
VVDFSETHVNKGNRGAGVQSWTRPS